MQLSFLTVSFLLSLAIATPVPKTSTKTTSAVASSATASTAVAAAGGVLTSSTYNDISISSGTAGNVESEANALFSAIDQTNLAGVAASDLEIISNTHDVAEDAEVQAFNPAIDAASGTDADALQVGKIKNKVLKLTATVLKLQIQAAQGKDVADDLATEQAKLTKNIATDVASAGEASTAVSFDGTT